MIFVRGFEEGDVLGFLRVKGLWVGDSKGTIVRSWTGPRGILITVRFQSKGEAVDVMKKKGRLKGTKVFLEWYRSFSERAKEAGAPKVGGSGRGVGMENRRGVPRTEQRTRVGLRAPRDAYTHFLGQRSPVPLGSR